MSIFFLAIIPPILKIKKFVKMLDEILPKIFLAKIPPFLKVEVGIFSE